MNLNLTSSYLVRVNNNGVKIRLDTESLIVCDTVENLGVVLDEDLNFSDHITYLYNIATEQALGRQRDLYLNSSLEAR